MAAKDSGPAGPPGGHAGRSDGELSQIDRFKEVARELGCDEDEAAFDKTLRKLAEAKHLPKHEPKKHPPK